MLTIPLGNRAKQQIAYVWVKVMHLTAVQSHSCDRQFLTPVVCLTASCVVPGRFVDILSFIKTLNAFHRTKILPSTIQQQLSPAAVPCSKALQPYLEAFVAYSKCRSVLLNRPKGLQISSMQICRCEITQQ